MKTKYTLLTIALLATTAMCLAPNFHPEQTVLNHYYWQADIAIHAGYYFALTLFLLALKLNTKPVYVATALLLFSFVLEFLQFFSFKRGVSVMDMGSNLLGITVATLLYFKLNKHFSKITLIKERTV